VPNLDERSDVPESNPRAVAAQAAPDWRYDLSVAYACVGRLQAQIIPNRKIALKRRHPAAAWLDLAASALEQAGYALEASERQELPVEPQLGLFGEGR
jgi:hypothetical protein